MDAGTPNSARSTRTVPLPNRALAAELRLFLVQHSRSGEPDALLWPGRALGSHDVDYSRPIGLGSFLKNYLRPALAADGLDDMRFHDFRHTCASLMLAVGFRPTRSAG